MPIYGHTFFSHNSKIAPMSLLKKCTHFGRKWALPSRRRHMVVGLQKQPKSWLTGYSVYLLGQPLSRNRVFQNFSGEPPSLYTRYPIVARALGLAVQPLGRVRARAKESCIQPPPPPLKPFERAYSLYTRISGFFKKGTRQLNLCKIDVFLNADFESPHMT